MIAVAAALLAGGCGLPIPEELTLVTAGYWIARGTAASPMIACAFSAVVAGDAMMVLAGRYGARLPFARRCVGAERLGALERAFSRHGVVLLACGRFVPGVRAALLVVAGATRLPLRRVALTDCAAALVSTTLWIAVGWRCAAHIDRARSVIGDARPFFAIVACAIAVAAASPSWRRVAGTLRRLFSRSLRRRRRTWSTRPRRST